MIMLRLRLTIAAAKELIEVIDIAQNEGYGHSESTYQFRDKLKKLVK